MPAVAKEYVYARLREILNGTDQTEAFRHLTRTDRAAILEIITETLPEFRR
jgi:hypothetical protein